MNSIVIFLHRLNIDGATMVVYDTLKYTNFCSYFEKITIVSAHDGEMSDFFRQLNVNVVCFPFDSLKYTNKELINHFFHKPSIKLLKKLYKGRKNQYYRKLWTLFLEHSHFWINSLDNIPILFRCALESNSKGIVLAHESLARDSFIRQTVDFSFEKIEYLNHMTLRENIKVLWPSSSTVEFGKKALNTDRVYKLPYFVTKTENENKEYSNLDTIKFMVTGWYCNRKNQKVIIDVFKEIEKKFANDKNYRNWNLTFVGTSYLDQEYYNFMDSSLNELPPSRLNFYSLIDNDKMKSKLANYHFVLIPAYSEALPVTVMDAMNCGTLVISTDCEGSEDMIKHEDNGFVYERQTFSQLFNILERILKKDVYLENDFTIMSNQAKEHIRTTFSMDKFQSNLNQYLNISLYEGKL